MTLSKSTKRWVAREENMQIEKKLHPLISIDGIPIFHRHVGKIIIFQAYLNGAPFNNRECHFSRDEILTAVDFYSENKIKLGWLVSRDIPIQEEQE